MSKDDDSSNLGITLALLGGGAILAWLLLRGGGKGWAGGKGWGHGEGGGSGRMEGTNGGSRDLGRSIGEADHQLHALPYVCLWIFPDHLELNGVTVDLATAISISRSADKVRVGVSGDTLHGRTEDIRHALEEARVIPPGEKLIPPLPSQSRKGPCHE